MLISVRSAPLPAQRPSPAAAMPTTGVSRTSTSSKIRLSRSAWTASSVAGAANHARRAAAPPIRIMPRVRRLELARGAGPRGRPRRSRRGSAG